MDEPRRGDPAERTPPAKKGELLAYYEVRLSGLTPRVVRRFAATGPRAAGQVAFALTHEALAKLAGDIAG